MRGDSRSKNGEGLLGTANRRPRWAPSATPLSRDPASIPRLRLRFTVRGLMFLVATIAVGCALWIHTPSAYGRIAACSILAFWGGYGCIMAGDELFVRGAGGRHLLSKALIGVGAPTLLLAVFTGVTSTMMALANRFIVSPHSSWSLTPVEDQGAGEERSIRRPTFPPRQKFEPWRDRRKPSDPPNPGQFASRVDLGGELG